GGAMLLLFFLMMGLMYWLCGLLGFVREDSITVLFCGSKKSLVQGAVMGKVLFPDPVILGVILLPLMIYHALQLMAGSAIAQRMGSGGGQEPRAKNKEEIIKSKLTGVRKAKLLSVFQLRAYHF